jgi:hypothetical protein
MTYFYYLLSKSVQLVVFDIIAIDCDMSVVHRMRFSRSTRFPPGAFREKTFAVYNCDTCREKDKLAIHACVTTKWPSIRFLKFDDLSASFDTNQKAPKASGKEGEFIQR